MMQSSQRAVGAFYGDSSPVPPLAALKFQLLSEGIHLSDDALAYINERNAGRKLTPADYASTSGIILNLDSTEWVNAPIALHNPNFVSAPTLSLEVVNGQLAVRSGADRIPATFWLSPAYHGESNADGDPYNSYAVTHGDRVRISPIQGCAMACQFCNIPYDFTYRVKRIDRLVESVRIALEDPVQPAGHVLISGGTPRADDYEFLRDCYQAVLTSFPQVPVDIMMVPIDGLLDVAELHAWGVHELSINLEIFDWHLARRIMRRKANLSQEHYLDFITTATAVLGAGSVRSMLLVGVEPLASTLAGVRAIAKAGGVPVLSPFRADPSTPMEAHPVASAAVLGRAYQEACVVAAAEGQRLGPGCAPCTHNTMTLADQLTGSAPMSHLHPRMV